MRCCRLEQNLTPFWRLIWLATVLSTVVVFTTRPTRLNLWLHRPMTRKFGIFKRVHGRRDGKALLILNWSAVLIAGVAIFTVFLCNLRYFQGFILSLLAISKRENSENRPHRSESRCFVSRALCDSNDGWKGLESIRVFGKGKVG